MISRLVSLLEIMEAFQGRELVLVGRHIRLALGADAPARSGANKISDADRANFIVFYERTTATCAALGLHNSVAQAERVVWVVKKPDATYGELEEHVTDLGRRVEDELASILLLHVPTDRAAYYLSPWAGWETISASFPSVSFDVEERAKCFALGRYTAAVFHSMRVLEVGLIMLADALGVDSAYANWQKVIDQIEAECKKLALDRSRKDDAQFYSEAATQFLYFKDAWRNHVMHVRQSFDEERAQRICDSTRAFMAHLATNLQE